MPKQTMSENSADGAVIAPDIRPEPVYVAPAPRIKQVERQGAQSEPFVRHWPDVRGGICEFCGVLDRNMPAEYQYKLCPHYRALNLRCSYCDENKNPDEVNYHANLSVVEHPDNPDKLIVCCDTYKCTEKHHARFKRN